MVKVVLDTNFVLIPFSEKVDIYQEINRILTQPYTLYITQSSLNELKNLKYAKPAQDLLQKKGVQTIPDSQKLADDAILALAKEEDIIVATQDKQLKANLQKLGRKIIILRQKQYCQLV